MKLLMVRARDMLPKQEVLWSFIYSILFIFIYFNFMYSNFLALSNFLTMIKRRDWKALKALKKDVVSSLLVGQLSVPVIIKESKHDVDEMIRQVDMSNSSKNTTKLFYNGLGFMLLS